MGGVIVLVLLLPHQKQIHSKYCALTEHSDYFLYNHTRSFPQRIMVSVALTINSVTQKPITNHAAALVIVFSSFDFSIRAKLICPVFLIPKIIYKR